MYRCQIRKYTNRCWITTLVSGSACKQFAVHHSILTTSERLNPVTGDPLIFVNFTSKCLTRFSQKTGEKFSLVSSGKRGEVTIWNMPKHLLLAKPVLRRNYFTRTNLSRGRKVYDSKILHYIPYKGEKQLRNTIKFTIQEFGLTRRLRLIRVLQNTSIFYTSPLH